MFYRLAIFIDRRFSENNPSLQQVKGKVKNLSNINFTIKAKRAATSNPNCTNVHLKI